jgi:hypothetical protein
MLFRERASRRGDRGEIAFDQRVVQGTRIAQRVVVVGAGGGAVEVVETVLVVTVSDVMAVMSAPLAVRPSTSERPFSTSTV